MKPSNLTSEDKRDAIIAAAEDKKANYITTLDLRGKTIIADFFVICSGTSNIHIRSVADGIMESLEKQGTRQRRMEGYGEASWVIVDYGDVLVHVMSEENRGFYGLEKLWTGQEPPARETPPSDALETEYDDFDEDTQTLSDEELDALDAKSDALPAFDPAKDDTP